MNEQESAQTREPQLDEHRREPVADPAGPYVVQTKKESGTSTGIAVGLSLLFPGLGHLYVSTGPAGSAGLKKAAINAGCTVVGILTIPFLIGLLIVPYMWIVSAFDAARMASQSGRGKPVGTMVGDTPDEHPASLGQVTESAGHAVGRVAGSFGKGIGKGVREGARRDK